MLYASLRSLIISLVRSFGDSEVQKVHTGNSYLRLGRCNLKYFLFTFTSSTAQRWLQSGLSLPSNSPFKCSKGSPALSSATLVDRAGRQWSGNLMTLKGALIRMTEYWPNLPDTKGVNCPVQFTNAELEEFFEKEEQLFQLNAVVNLWREQIGGASEDGWISNENYESARQKVVELMESLIAIAEGDQEDIALLEKGWPFRDQEGDN
ncbi:hypothetical protein AFLA70_11g005480 [Aspergillus flavus AF70]|nr:hypothetical protein AFLA70_11g005480 [Aspergillus flavus AF70]